MIGVLAPSSVFGQMDVTLARPCNVTALICTTAILTFSLKMLHGHELGIDSTDFLEYRSLLPFTHDPMEKVFLNTSSIWLHV